MAAYFANLEWKTRESHHCARESIERSGVSPVHEHTPSSIADSEDHEDSASSLFPKLESSNQGFGELLTRGFSLELEIN